MKRSRRGSGKPTFVSGPVPCAKRSAAARVTCSRAVIASRSSVSSPASVALWTLTSRSIPAVGNNLSHSPAFNAALIKGLAQAGILRIGVIWRDETPVAAQYWSVVNGAATVLKLAHDQSLRALSPGTVLTAATIRELIEIDGIRELDFGRGDDPYKRNWVSQRRLRIGLLGMNVRTVTGLRHWAVHDSGKLLGSVRSLIKPNEKSGEQASTAT